MTRHQARRERRAAERKAKKAEEKRNRAFKQSLPVPNLSLAVSGLSETGFVSQESTNRAAHAVSGLAKPKRAEINRANALHSTGPTTPQGKLASSRNSLKHGLASGEIIIPGEDPAAFDALLQDLLQEHQPANATEELLVNQMAQSYWLAQRALRMQNECFTENGVDEKRLALFLRYQTTHDRAFHKALATLIRLRRGRACPAHGFVSQRHADARLHDGFASQNHPDRLPSEQFVRQNASSEPHEATKSRVEAA